MNAAQQAPGSRTAPTDQQDDMFLPGDVNDEAGRQSSQRKSTMDPSS